MQSSSTLKFLPLFLAILAIGGAVFFYSSRQTTKTKVQNVISKLPEPTPFVPVKPFVTPTYTITPTPTPLKEIASGTVVRENSSQVRPSTGTKSETICTPVYGMANSCAEHAVVDTGLETSAFYNLAALSYISGLAAFIKAKRKSR